MTVCRHALPFRGFGQLTLVVMGVCLPFRRHEVKFKLWAVSMAMTLHPGCFLDCLSSPECDWCSREATLNHIP